MSKLIGIGENVEFMVRLAEAVAWCNKHANVHEPKSCLRSNSIAPWILDRDRASMVKHVVNRRERAFGNEKPRPVRSSNDLLGGKLLVYFPDENLCDGAAEMVSKGFFDVENVPPWDTWVALFHDPGTIGPSFRCYLVSYVPQPLVTLTNDGIEINPEECIMWLENSKTSLSRHLKQLI